jgi:hypothetical protein
MKKTQPKAKSNAAELFERGRQILTQVSRTPPPVPAPAIQPAAVPNWVTETPEYTKYALVMDNFGTGERDQDIELSRAEFIALKQHLAQIRGCLSARAAARPPDPSIFNRVFEAALSDLSLEKGEIPALARLILRMRRDKAPDDEVLRMTEPLFKSIVGSAIKADWKSEQKSGMSQFDIKPTPQLNALLRSLRGKANA